MRKKYSPTTDKRTDRVKPRERGRMKKLRESGLTYEEIAAKLERSDKTVRKQLRPAEIKNEPPSTKSVMQEKETQAAIEARRAYLIRTHDKRIFFECDDILSDVDVQTMLWDLDKSHWVDGDDLEQIRVFHIFVDWESNKYINQNLRNLCEKFRETAGDFIEFIGCCFDDLGMCGRTQRHNKLQYNVMPNKSYKLHDGYVVTIENARLKEDEVRYAFEKAYNDYRAAIRETFYL